MKFFLPIILLFSLAIAQASPSRALESVDADLRNALGELTETRRQIEVEKLPLAQRLAELEAEVAEKRREATRLQQARDTGELALENLRSETETRAAEVDFVENLIGEYIRGFESRIDVAEIPLYDKELLRIKQTIQNTDIPQQQRLSQQLSIVEISIARLRYLCGGRSFDGQALDPEGVVTDGRFAQVGPLVWFASETDVSGISLQAASLKPRVQPVSEKFTEGVQNLVFEGNGAVPVDPTLGNAIVIAGSKETFVEHLKKGRIWMIPIVAFAVIAVLISIFKFFDIFFIKRPSPTLVPELLTLIREGKQDEAKQRTEKMRGPFGRLLRAAVANASAGKEQLDEILYEHTVATQPRLERFLPVLAVTAATAPLLGLLGTVTGMINTFTLINLFGTGNPRSLASGISEALVTTEAGLVVAIFALIAHALLSRRAQGLLATMEKISVGFVNGLGDSKK